MASRISPRQSGGPLVNLMRSSERKEDERRCVKLCDSLSITPSAAVKSHGHICSTTSVPSLSVCQYQHNQTVYALSQNRNIHAPNFLTEFLPRPP